MATIDGTVAVVTPCCQRKVRGTRIYEYATDYRHRTCPACGQRWGIVITPLSTIRNREGFIHRLEWVRLEGALP